ncbi:unnamed protein product [Staurois parvus]|uniref:Uncharacterized protein n=1 Tax=Staurois parvus TaxID=386267 RepID=A0ABN9HMS0_9NEOB|nr:unnamed protein product [Staurois parvus]
MCSGYVVAYSSHHTQFQCSFDAVCHVPVWFCAEKMKHVLLFFLHRKLTGNDYTSVN